MENPEHRLPKEILDKAVKSGDEYGWRESDFLQVVEYARGNFMALLGGQIQYALPDGTCELYWLEYDPQERQPDESWINYCNRTADETTKKFKLLISKDIEGEALASFDFLKTKKESGINLNEYLTFILYFDDTETEVHV